MSPNENLPIELRFRNLPLWANLYTISDVWGIGTVNGPEIAVGTLRPNFSYRMRHRSQTNLSRECETFKFNMGLSDMITVTPTLLTEGDVTARLAAIARRYHIPEGSYDDSAADHMSDFDALKWASLCDLLKAARMNRICEGFDNFCIPGSLRSIYGMQDSSQTEELENTGDLIDLAA